MRIRYVLAATGRWLGLEKRYMSDYKILLCEQCAGLKAELSQADFDRKAWKADCRRTQAALDAEHLSRLSSDEQMRFQIKRAEGLQAEVSELEDDRLAGVKREVALTTELGAALEEHEAMRVENEAMTARFVPLVEENERLTREAEESSIARTIHFGEAERLRERVAALTTALREIVHLHASSSATDTRRPVDVASAALAAQPAATGEGTP